MFTVRKAADTTFPIMLSKRDPDGWNLGALNFLNDWKFCTYSKTNHTVGSAGRSYSVHLGVAFIRQVSCPALRARGKHKHMCTNGQSSYDPGAQMANFSSFFLLVALDDVTKKASLIWSSQPQKPHPKFKRKVKGEWPKQLFIFPHRG